MSLEWHMGNNKLKCTDQENCVQSSYLASSELAVCYKENISFKFLTVMSQCEKRTQISMFFF